MTQTQFSDLQLIAPLQKALTESGYKTPTPIQQQAIPIILSGRDLLGIAQTGTGKTAAFSLPILQLLHEKRTHRQPRCPRAVILTPTRELAIQIHKSLQTYGSHLKQKYAVIFGGVGQGNQVRDLSQGTDILVATPGRLLDLIGQKHLRLDQVEIFVLDEADRMLDMGFMRDIQKILPLLPSDTHNLFFSATMPPEIAKLAHSLLKNPQKVEVTPAATTVEKIAQSVLFVEKKNKLSLLMELLDDPRLYKVLVFVEMKHVASRIAEKLEKAGIPSAAIHGNKSQGARQRAIEDFTKDRIRVLVATDIASRGIDIDGITHVINFELPNLPESYVHRIGRTARAGTEGEAFSFCSAEEKFYLFAIEKATRQKIRARTDHSYHSEETASAPAVAPRLGRGQTSSARGDRNRSGGSGGRSRPSSQGRFSRRNSKSSSQSHGPKKR